MRLKAIPRPLLERFLLKAKQQGGQAGRTQAVRVLHEIDTSPPDYQRILVHSRLGKDRLVSLSRLPAGIDQPGDSGHAGTPGSREDVEPERTRMERDLAAPLVDLAQSPDWIVLWSDFEPTSDAESRLESRVAGQEPRWSLEMESVWVRAYSLSRPLRRSR